MTKITAAVVVAAYVKSARADLALDSAAIVSRDARIARALVTRDALASGVTAKAIAAESADAIATDPKLAAVFVTTPKQVIMEGHVGTVYALEGEMPMIEILGDLVEMGPRDVLSLVKRVTDAGKGAAAILRKLATAEDRAGAVQILADGLAALTAKPKAPKAPKASEGDVEAAEGGAEGGAPETALDKITRATALVVDALSGDLGTAEIEALRALVAMIDESADTLAAAAA